MEAFSDHSKRNEDTLKDIENRFSCFEDKFKRRFKRNPACVRSGYKNGQINTLGKDFKTLC